MVRVVSDDVKDGERGQPSSRGWRREGCRWRKRWLVTACHLRPRLRREAAWFLFCNRQRNKTANKLKCVVTHNPIPVIITKHTHTEREKERCIHIYFVSWGYQQVRSFYCAVWCEFLPWQTVLTCDILGIHCLSF